MNNEKVIEIINYLSQLDRHELANILIGIYKNNNKRCYYCKECNIDGVGCPEDANDGHCFKKHKAVKLDDIACNDFKPLLSCPICGKKFPY
jgi:hypothetical protein